MSEESLQEAGKKVSNALGAAATAATDFAFCLDIAAYTCLCPCSTEWWNLAVLFVGTFMADDLRLV